MIGDRLIFHTVKHCDTTRVIKPVDGLEMHAYFDTVFDTDEL